MKKISLFLLPLFAVLLLTKCSSLPTGGGSVVQGFFAQMEGAVSDAAVQALIDFAGKYQLTAKLDAKLNTFAVDHLGWIAEEMKIANGFAIDAGIPLDPPVNLTPEQAAQVQAIIQDADARYFNRYGWINGSPGNPATAEYDNENPSLFTGEYLWLVSRLGALAPLKTIYQPRFKTQVGQMQLQPGLYDRFGSKPRPKAVEPFSHDETQGLIQIDHLFGFQLGFSVDQQKFGKKYDYVYMNGAWSAPNQFNRPMFSYLNGDPVSKARALLYSGRYFGQVEEIRRTGGVPTSLASDLILCAEFMTSLTLDCAQTSTPILMMQRASFLQGKSEVLDGCIYQYKYLVEKKFAKGNLCNGKPVVCDNAYCGMADIYFPAGHPIRTLAAFLPPGAG